MTYRFAVGMRQGNDPINYIRVDYCRELMLGGLGTRVKNYLATNPKTPTPKVYLNSYWNMKVPVLLSARVSRANGIMAEAGFDKQLFYQDQDDLLEKNGWVETWPDIVTELPLLHAILGFLKLETAYTKFMLGMMAHMVNNRDYKLKERTYDGCASFLRDSNPSLWEGYARELLASGKGDLLGHSDLVPIARTLILYKTGFLSQEMLDTAFLRRYGCAVPRYVHIKPPRSIWDMTMAQIMCESKPSHYGFSTTIRVPIPELKTNNLQELTPCDLSLFDSISYPYNE